MQGVLDGAVSAMEMKKMRKRASFMQLEFEEDTDDLLDANVKAEVDYNKSTQTLEDLDDTESAGLVEDTGKVPDVNPTLNATTEYHIIYHHEVFMVGRHCFGRYWSDVDLHGIGSSGFRKHEGR